MTTLPRLNRPTSVKSGGTHPKITYSHTIRGGGMISVPNSGTGRWNSGGQRRGKKIYGTWHNSLTGRAMMMIEDIPIVGVGLSRLAADGVEFIRRILP